MGLSEEHKRRLAEGREAYQKRRREEKERLRAQAEGAAKEPEDAFASSRVIRRKKTFKREESNVTHLGLDITSEGLLKRAEATLEAATELVGVASELVSEARKRQ